MFDSVQRAGLSSAGSLPLFLSEADNTPPAIVDASKEAMKKAYGQGLAQYNAKSGAPGGGTSVLTDYKKILKMMELWDREDFGKLFADEIVDNLQQAVGKNIEEVYRRVLTGSSTGKISSSKSYGEKSVAALKAVQEQVDMLMTSLGQLDPKDAYHKALQELKKYVDSELAVNKEVLKYTGKPEKNIKWDSLSGKGEGKLDSTVKRIHNIVAQIAQGNLGGIENLSPADVIKKLNSLFNSLQGEGWHEYLVEASINQVNKKVENEVFKPLREAFSRQGFTFVGVSASTVANNAYGAEGTKMQGRQIKGDLVAVLVSEGGVVFHVPISAKKRLGQKNWTPPSGGKGGTHGKVHVQSISIGELLAMTLVSGNASYYEHGWGVYLLAPEGKHSNKVEESDLSGRETSWRDFQKAAKMIGMYRALMGTNVGTDGKGTDFAGVFWVNEKVYSMGYLINRAKRSFLMGETWNGVGGNQFPGYFQAVKRPTKSEVNSKTRASRVRSDIETLYKKKINFTINLDALAK